MQLPRAQRTTLLPAWRSHSSELRTDASPIERKPQAVWFKQLIWVGTILQ